MKTCKVNVQYELDFKDIFDLFEDGYRHTREVVKKYKEKPLVEDSVKEDPLAELNLYYIDNITYVDTVENKEYTVTLESLMSTFSKMSSEVNFHFISFIKDQWDVNTSTWFFQNAVLGKSKYG